SDSETPGGKEQFQQRARPGGDRLDIHEPRQPGPGAVLFQSVMSIEVRVGGACEVVCWQRVRVGGACGPPPPVAAALVPRCALLPAAAPRDGPSAATTSWMSLSLLPSRSARGQRLARALPGGRETIGPIAGAREAPRLPAQRV